MPGGWKYHGINCNCRTCMGLRKTKGANWLLERKQRARPTTGASPPVQTPPTSTPPTEGLSPQSTPPTRARPDNSSGAQTVKKVNTRDLLAEIARESTSIPNALPEEVRKRAQTPPPAAGQPGQPCQPVHPNFIITGGHIRAVGKLLKTAFDEPEFLPDEEGAGIIAECTNSYCASKGIVIDPEWGLGFAYLTWLGPPIVNQIKKRKDDIALALARMQGKAPTDGSESPAPAAEPAQVAA